MQNTPSPSPSPTYLRLNVWGLALATAVTVFFAGLVMMALHSMFGAHFYHMGRANSHWMAYGSLSGVWFFLAPLIHAVLAGIVAAVFAAVYNAVPTRRGLS
jgi:hypothetical protein